MDDLLVHLLQRVALDGAARIKTENAADPTHD
jgi:hypothetical protein